MTSPATIAAINFALLVWFGTDLLWYLFKLRSEAVILPLFLVKQPFVLLHLSGLILRQEFFVEEFIEINCNA